MLHVGDVTDLVTPENIQKATGRLTLLRRANTLAHSPRILEHPDRFMNVADDYQINLRNRERHEPFPWHHPSALFEVMQRQICVGIPQGSVCLVKMPTMVIRNIGGWEESPRLSSWR